MCYVAVLSLSRTLFEAPNLPTASSGHCFLIWCETFTSGSQTQGDITLRLRHVFPELFFFSSQDFIIHTGT